jgi:N-methylhydantoinase A
MTLRIGIDIGGTFTDFVVYRPENEQIESFKLLSTPADPSEAVLEGLRRVLEKPEFDLPPGSLQIVHGSTVATNALLERKGARMAFVATRGFADLLEIGRQNRPALYDLFADPPPVLAPPEMRLEVDERISSEGEILVPLDARQVENLVPILLSIGAGSVAVCLLFSFLRPEHERLIGEQLRQAGLFVSLSSEILPEFREYERASTTAVNAYVSPVMDRYLARLETGLGETGSLNAGPSHGNKAGPETAMRMMQSNGGQISLPEARRAAVRCILSGPAGGIIGAQKIARLATPLGSSPTLAQAGEESSETLRLITFDMGGTSTDVSLIDGEPLLTKESVIGGCPIGIPMLDIHTIGAGGGSIASVDLGRALRVGPQSAGADPGPACYGRGDLPTVTDANLVLGRLAPEYFLGGRMPLDPARAHQALTNLGSELNMDAIQAALGVVDVVNAHMERALRLISVERGRDPGRASGAPYTLLSFGGAGGLHALDLARGLDIPFVLISPFASTLSAFGMLVSEVVKDYTQTIMLPGDAPFDSISAAVERLVERAIADMRLEGFSPTHLSLEPLLDLRYRGQSYELAVSLPESSSTLASGFHQAHRQAYGYDRPGAAIEIVNARLRAIGYLQPPKINPQPLGDPDPSPALFEYRTVIGSDGRNLRAPLYRYELLHPGCRFDGPALIIRADTTVWLGPRDRCFIDGFLNLLIEVGGQDA